MLNDFHGDPYWRFVIVLVIVFWSCVVLFNFIRYITHDPFDD